MKKYATPVVSRENKTFVFYNGRKEVYRSANIQSVRQWIKNHVVNFLIVDTRFLSLEEAKNILTDKH